MTDKQKIIALTDLLYHALNTLDLKSYDIEDPHKSYQCEVEADKYHEQMMQILHSQD